MSEPMQVPPSVKAPTSPQVNLIPAEVAKRREQGRSRLMVLFALVIFVGVLFGAVVWADASASAAESALASEQAKADKLNAKIAEYAIVPQVKAELQNATNARTYAGVFDTPWLSIWDQLLQALPASARLDNASWGSTSPAGVAAQSTSPFASDTIGMVTFAGSSLEYVDAADVVDAINSIYGFTDASISTTQREDTDGFVYYTFTGEFRFTAAILTFRFSDQWFERATFFDAVRDARLAIVDAQQALDDANRELKAIPEADAARRAAQQKVVENAAQAVLDAINQLNLAQKALDEYDAQVIQDRNDRIEATKNDAAEESPQPSPSPSPKGGK